MVASVVVTSSAISASDLGGRLSISLMAWRVWATVMAGVFPPESLALEAEEPVRDEAQSHVSVPGRPRLDFVLVQADLSLGAIPGCRPPERERLTT